MPGLKFRILLDSKNNEEVFRDIILGDSDTFESFHKAIVNAFNFSGEEMASFYVSNDQWDKGHEISLIDFYNNEEPDVNCSTMNNTSIKDFINEPDQKFIFIYDFLNMWIFLIELIGYESEEPQKPSLILSVGESPKENENTNLDSLMFQNNTSELESDIDLQDIDDEDYYDYEQ